MAVDSKTIKITDKAFSILHKEMNFRLNSNNLRIKLKDIASDLIILGYENKQSQEKMFDQTILYLSTIKNWEKEHNPEIIQLTANIIYWEHIKLALSKGFEPNSAKDHVNQYLTNSINKKNIIGVFENFLNSLKV